MNVRRLFRILFCLLLLAQSAAAALTIRSHGGDMSDSLLCAISRHDTVVLDGAAGEFVIGHTMVLRHMQHKVIMGINDACLRTRFSLTNEIRGMLDSADVLAYRLFGDELRPHEFESCGGSGQGRSGSRQTTCDLCLLHVGRRVPPTDADGEVWYDLSRSLQVGMSHAASRDRRP